MSEASAQPQPTPKSRRLLVKILIGAAYLAIGVLLVGWELQEQGDLYSSDSCNLRSTPQSENPFLDPLYESILSHSTSGSWSNVSVVGIDSSLQVLQNNVCQARAFTADLIDAIKAQGASVIAIDKFYGPDACPPGDTSTKELQTAVTSLQKPPFHIPLVVGGSTHSPPSATAASCIALTPQLELGTGVQRGLTRLNWDVLKLPLRWPVLLHDNDAKPSKGPESETFSVVAASQKDSSLLQNADFKRLLDCPQQPYANVTGILERQSASNLLCSVAAHNVITHWNLACPWPAVKINLQNKVVVIGAESDADFPAVLGEGMYGFELQAHYVAAILSGSYLRQISPLFLLLPLGIYYALSELLIPYLHIHHHPPRPLFHINRPLTWTVGVFFATIAIGFFVPLALHRFPPLGVLLGISGILIPRLLIEGWALLNEHMEDPKEDGLA
jgi:CHASE2 domain-containing sensor protein